MTTVQERIDLLVQHSGRRGLKALAGYLGVNAQRLYDIRSGKVKEISTSLANKIFLAFPEVDRDWVVTGEGEMIKKESTPPTVNTSITLPKETIKLNLNLSETVRSQQETIQQLTDMLKQALGMRQATTPKKDIAG